MADQEQENQENIVEADAEVKEVEPDTGELPRISLFGRLKHARDNARHSKANAKPERDNCRADNQTIAEEEESDDFKRQRRLIESFSEDYLGLMDRIKLTAAKVVALLLPVIAVAAVGTDIGAFFAQALGAFSSYTLSYGIESGIAALTIMLGMALQKTSEGPGHWIRVAVAALVWLVASLASGLVMYVIAVANMPIHPTSFYYTVIGLRTFAVMLLDLMSVCVLFFRGKSLQKFLHEQAQKGHAIQAVNESELAITRAQEQAKIRKQEDEQYIEGKKRSAEVVIELQEMTNQAILEMARRNLLKPPDDGNNRRIGRY